MSMKCYELTLSDGKTVQLRLTARGIKNYLEKNDLSGVAPVVGVMSAVSNMDALIDLLTNALKFNGAQKGNLADGADLIDHLADEGKGSAFLRELVVRLACDAGLVDEEDVPRLLEAMDMDRSKIVSGIVQILKGKDDGKEPAKDPT